MIPNLEILGKTFSAYMIIATVGYLITLLVLVKIAKKSHLDEFHMLYILLFAAIGVLIGGHMFYGLTNINLIVKLITNVGTIGSFKEFVDCLMIIFGGTVFYGGMLGAVAVAFIYIKRNKLNSSQYINAAIMAVPLFHFFGRIGCFLSGCCYGIEWEGGITYHHAIIETANGVARFPVQLIEAAVNIILFLILLFVYTKTKWSSKIFCIYFLAYPTCRFFLENLRGDEYRGFWLGLSTSQIISLVLIAVTLTSIEINHKKRFVLPNRTEENG